jgi:hypothetical protein
MNDHDYCSSETTKLAKALIQVQRILQPATKDRLNPFTHSNYATLNSVMDSCREALLANGIWLTQYPVPAEPGHLGLVTKLVHAESGQWQSSHAVVPLPKNDPQGLGIAMTYIRRYSISAMLGIVTEEDTDGNMPKDSGRSSGPRQKRNLAMQDSATSPHTSGRSQPALLPNLDGITYQEITATDGQVCIVATGNTQAKKELLAGAGFKWNPQRKMWWKYAQAS